MMNNTNKGMGIYVHIPFCLKKCNYCDFNSFSGKEDVIERYFSILNKEIKTFQEEKDPIGVNTIYIGGGTPSIVDAIYINKLMKTIRSKFDVERDAEISIEMNPGTVTKDKLKLYKEAGINRLSIGLQAWQKNLLDFLGRIHNQDDFIKSIEFARQVGFENISVDIMFGIPGQSLHEWKETLEKVIGFSPNHISAYSLKIEDGTVFGKLYNKKKIEYLDEEIERQMYYHTNEYLFRCGYKHYEISNYAKAGYESRHNIRYWDCDEYLGFGAGAHSYFNGIRYSNKSSLDGYMKAIKNDEQVIEYNEEINKQESMKEFMILGLRKVEGINAEEFERKYKENLFSIYGDKIQQLKEEGLLQIKGTNIRLTPKGLDFANLAFGKFI